jgi:hypothetical protein
MLEVVCAIWMVAVMGGAAVGAWAAAAHEQARTEVQRSADDCADDAAEYWLAGQAVTLAANDTPGCAVDAAQTTIHGEDVVTLVARVDGASQTLYLPSGPGTTS